jgi:hypothetical protein
MTILKERGFYETPIDKLARQSYSGMAHFAGTGPDGRRCGACAFFDRKDDKPEAICTKYKALTNRIGKLIPLEALACKYFEAKR